MNRKEDKVLGRHTGQNGNGAQPSGRFDPRKGKGPDTAGGSWPTRPFVLGRQMAPKRPEGRGPWRLVDIDKFVGIE